MSDAVVDVEAERLIPEEAPPSVELQEAEAPSASYGSYGSTAPDAGKVPFRSPRVADYVPSLQTFLWSLMAAVIFVAIVIVGWWFLFGRPGPEDSIHYRSLLINTPLGKIKGIIHHFRTVTNRSPQLVLFHSIPFAEHQPTGSRRFHLMDVRTTPWRKTRDGMFVNKHTCMQPKHYMMEGWTAGEDCLYLSVAVPYLVVKRVIDYEKHKDKKKKEAKALLNVTKLTMHPAEPEESVSEDVEAPALVPVIVHIHGGFMKYSHEVKYWHTPAETGVVVVKVSYRLGALGFLAVRDTNTTHGSGGMLGAGDIVTALQWVQGNIAAFGGDPNQVTLYGHSAGSMLVCALAVSERAKGLISAAILESGTCTGPLKGTMPPENGATFRKWFMLAMGIKSHHELWSADAQDMVEVYDTADRLTMAIDQVGAGLFWANSMYSVDGYILTKSPAELYQEGRLHVDRMLVMTMSLDTSIVGRLDPKGKDRIYAVDKNGIDVYAPRTNDEYVDAVTNWTKLLVDTTSLNLDADTLVAQILEKYPAPEADAAEDAALELFFHVDGDATVVCPLLQVAQWSAAARVETYHGVFAYGPAGVMGQSQSGIDLYGSAATRRHLLTPMDEPEGESRHLACHSDIGKFVWFGAVLIKYTTLRLLAERIQMYFSSLTSVQGLRSVTMIDGYIAHWDPIDERCTYNDTLFENNTRVSIQYNCTKPNETNTLVFDVPEIQHTEDAYRKDLCAWWNDLLVEPPYQVSVLPDHSPDTDDTDGSDGSPDDGQYDYGS